MGRAKKDLSKERQLYRLLGIPLLQRLVLRLERWLHRRDRGQNENYHPSGTGPRALRHFTLFLKCNTGIHIFGLLLVALYYLVYGNHFPVLSALVGIVALVNVWCILLQRDHFLAMEALVERKAARRLSRAEAAAKELVLPYQLLPEGSRLMARLRDAAEGKGVCLLTQADGQLLERLAPILGSAVRAAKPQLPASTSPEPYQKMENRLLRLCRSLGLQYPFPRGGLVFASSQVYDAFCLLFPRGTEEECLYMAALWALAAEKSQEARAL